MIRTSPTTAAMGRDKAAEPESHQQGDPPDVDEPAPEPRRRLSWADFELDDDDPAAGELLRAVERFRHGVIDQREREFLPAERRIAELLASEGRAVYALRESDAPGVRRPDALVDDQATEFKSPDPGATNVTVKAALGDAKGQAHHAVVDGRGTGLTEAEAERGLRRFLGAHPHRMETVRIVGDDFDIRWNWKG